VKRVLLDKTIMYEKIKQRIKLFDIPVPELSNKGLQIIRVKLASLDDQIKAAELSSASVKAMLKMYRDIKSGDAVDLAYLSKSIFTSALSPKAEMIISLFSKCVVEPAFTLDDAEALAEAYPDLVNRVVLFALKSNEPEVVENG